MISIVPSNQLNQHQYNRCSTSSDNFFMQQWVLDILCPRWSAVVVDDYDSVLPFANQSKYFIPYIYQAAYIPMFSLLGNPRTAISRIAKVLKKKFPLIHFDTDINGFPTKWIKRNRTNYILPLSQDYNDIFSQEYSDECRKNIDKAVKRGCHIEPTQDWLMIFELYDEIYGRRKGNHLIKAWQRGLQFTREAASRGHCKGYKIVNDSGALLYAGILIEGEQRVYYWLGAPTPQGRQNRVTYFFIDYLIRLYSRSNKLFDFEGSDFPNVARFYSGFTRHKEEYHEIKTTWIG